MVIVSFIAQLFVVYKSMHVRHGAVVLLFVGQKKKNELKGVV
jgi:hypothetical protein